MQSVKWLFFILAIGLAVLAGSMTATAESPKKGGTLVVAMDSEADFLDNQAAGGWITWRVNRCMFDTLIQEDLTVEDVTVPPIIPGLAEKWELSDDGLVYTFTLRKGVLFHDGTELTADVVKWNIDRMWCKSCPQYSAKAGSCTAFSWQALEEVKVVDKYTIKLIQNRPFGEFVNKQVDGGCGNVSLMSPKNWEKWGNENIGEHPVGTGPFKFVERVRGEKIVLERNENYWGAKLNKRAYQEPYVDRIIFRPMEDAASRIAALQAGEVDLVWSPPPDSIEPMVKKGFKVSMGPTPHVLYFSLNMRQPALKDIKVRKAIQHAIDREGIARDLLKGTALPAYSMLVPGCPSYDPDYKPYEYDPEKARQLLAESNYPDGPELTLIVPTGGSGNITPVPITEWVQRNLNDVGFKTKVETYEWQTYLSFWWKGTQEGQSAYWMGWGMATPFWIEVVGHSKWWPTGGSNVGWYKNEKVDALLDQAMTELDDEKRYKIYAEANKIVMDDASMVAIVHDKTPVLMGPNVNGYVHAPQNWKDLRTVWLDR